MENLESVFMRALRVPELRERRGFSPGRRA